MDMQEKIKEITKFLKENKNDIQSIVIVVETTNEFKESALVPDNGGRKLKMIGLLESIKLELYETLDKTRG